MRSNEDKKLNVVMVGGSVKYGLEAMKYFMPLILEIKKSTNVDVVHQDLFSANKGALEWQNLMIDTEGNFNIDKQAVLSQVPKLLMPNEELTNMQQATLCGGEYPIVEVDLCG